MKRLCVFYKDADKWLGRKIDWIVCQRCKRKLRQGYVLVCKVDGLRRQLDSIPWRPGVPDAKHIK